MSDAIEKSKSFGESLNNALNHVASELEDVNGEKEIKVNRHFRHEVEELLRERGFDFEKVDAQKEKVTLRIA